MEIILQKELPHQQKAIDAVCDVFAGVEKSNPAIFYENPQFDLSDIKIKSNINEIQTTNNISNEHRASATYTNCLKLDIKMETGTGKTYVYTKTIYELHKKYKINKFVIVVPTLPIKAGTAQFLQDTYAQRHFTDACGYGTEIELGVVEASKGKLKGRTYFPSEVSNFVKGSYQNTRKIYVLLLNMQLLTNAEILTRDDYDYGAEGFYRPMDAIQASKPFVIIDEPHRFDKKNQAYQIIEHELKPQCIIRYGATFPETIFVSGKKKIKTKDYQNLLYDLNACQAFNQGLVKGVAKEHIESISEREEMVKITSIESFDTVHFQYIRREAEGKIITKAYPLKKNDPLSIISDEFEGIIIKDIGEHTVEFSNDIIKKTGEEWDVNVLMSSYQEQMLKLALQRHFEIERANFCNRQHKIKTLALFFIDDISSYRDTKTGKPTYLLTAFERLLKKQIEKTLALLTEHESEYREYLQASLADLRACHEGYFAQDNRESQAELAKRVKVILSDKKKLLSFKDENGSYFTLRFLFSKWTLKEGWDNPNVFTIAKLRSSDSDISKLQEVGRGLRLPVDEHGNRISNEEFMLNYIVDFRERDFAEELVSEINAEITHADVITNEKLEEVAQKLGLLADDLFDELRHKRYIDRQFNIIAENRNAFFIEYPDFAVGLTKGKISNRNKEKPKRVKIRKELYNEELKPLWESINKRYLLFYNEAVDSALNEQVLSLFEKPDIFIDHYNIQSERKVVRGDGVSVQTENSTGVQYSVDAQQLGYNEFLKRISNVTSLPIKTIHKALCDYVAKHGSIESKYFNDNTVASFCRAFAEWRDDFLAGEQIRIYYRASSAPLGATALTYADGTPFDDIAQNLIGIEDIQGAINDKYLYDTYAYDSQLEKKNILSEIDGVVAYGKIPRRSIAIPTIMGGTYSPDFMYVVQHERGTKVLNVIVETKDVEGKSELRGTEKIKIKCAEEFFKALQADGIKVNFRTQLQDKPMKQIIDEITGVQN